MHQRCQQTSCLLVTTFIAAVVCSMVVFLVLPISSAGWCGQLFERYNFRIFRCCWRGSCLLVITIMHRRCKQTSCLLVTTFIAAVMCSIMVVFLVLPQVGSANCFRDTTSGSSAAVAEADVYLPLRSCTNDVRQSLLLVTTFMQ